MSDREYEEYLANTDFPAERKRLAVTLFFGLCVFFGYWLRERDGIALGLTVLVASMLALMLWRIRLDSTTPPGPGAAE